MKCYEFDHAKINNGMTITTDDNFGKIVFLGINNQKSKALKIALDKNNPALVKDGRMLDAWPRIVYTRSKTNFTVFQKPLRASQDILLRVNTSSSESDNVINGTWRVNQGEPQIIFTANGRRKLTRFCDDIIKMTPGDSIMINLECDSKEFEVKNENGKIKMIEPAVQEAEEALA
jgi:hypothetical protein